MSSYVPFCGHFPSLLLYFFFQGSSCSFQHRELEASVCWHFGVNVGHRASLHHSSAIISVKLLEYPNGFCTIRPLWRREWMDEVGSHPFLALLSGWLATDWPAVLHGTTVSNLSFSCLWEPACFTCLEWFNAVIILWIVYVAWFTSYISACWLFLIEAQL